MFGVLSLLYVTIAWVASVHSCLTATLATMSPTMSSFCSDEKMFIALASFLNPTANLPSKMALMPLQPLSTTWATRLMNSLTSIWFLDFARRVVVFPHPVDDRGVPALGRIDLGLAEQQDLPGPRAAVLVIHVGGGAH